PLHEGGSYRIVVEGRPYVTAASAIVEIPDSEAEVKDIDLEVRLEAAVRGLVVDGVGLPVPGAQVQVIAVTETSGANAAEADPGGTPATLSGGAGGARADAVGAFEVSGLREG